MTNKAGRGNVASSQISRVSESNYLNYKGEKAKLILSPDNARLTPHLKPVPYKDMKGNILEISIQNISFFEYIYNQVLNGKLKNQEIYILSQKKYVF